VYLCYGIHHLFNVVTNKEGSADAVLIRAVEPVEGVEIMLKRRSMTKVEKRLTAGPGVLSQALGIQTIHYGTALNSNIIWIEEGEPVGNDQVASTTRIGVDYAEGDALKPWRFYIKENGWVSRF
ncbi:MAG: DNA-3-methyladenine glycosylase, partial [Cyclobacteriaceae bacterium]|nr:DNA-3-methyladenine glycosylase [Cyclobacteriaceae bacterium]